MLKVLTLPLLKISSFDKLQFSLLLMPVSFTIKRLFPFWNFRILTLLIGIHLLSFWETKAQDKLHFLLEPDTTVFTRPDLTLYFDGRNSFVKHTNVTINSINAGVVFGKRRHELTLGYSWVRKDQELYYLNLMYLPYLFYTPRWHIAMPVEIGIGSSDTTNTSFIKEIEIWKKDDWFVPLQLGIYTEFRATRYIGISALIGYRKSLVQQNPLDNFDGLYYSFGLNAYPGVLWRDFKRRRIKKK
jgi:hypothetical protein